MIIIDFLIGFLFALFWWAVLTPVVWVCATPYMVVASVFSRKPFRQAFTDRLEAVTKWWKEYGIYFVP